MDCRVESQTRALGLPGFIALGCSILNPCMSQVNCSQVSCLTSCAFRGHWYRPLSSLLYSRTNPSGSHSNAFSRSQRLPQNRNKLLAYGSSLKCCWMNILVREYRCSGGTDTANPAAGNRCSGTGIPHLLNCLLPASLLA